MSDYSVVTLTPLKRFPTDTADPIRHLALPARQTPQQKLTREIAAPVKAGLEEGTIVQDDAWGL